MTTNVLAHDAPMPVLGTPLGTLDQAIVAWLDAAGGRSGSAKTRTAYADGIARFRAALQAAGIDLDGEARAVALAAQAWASTRDSGSRSTGPISPATYNVRLAILSSFYTYARKRGFLTGDHPIALVDRRTVAVYATAVPLDDAAIAGRLRQIDRTDRTGARDYALLVVFLQTGRRLAEVASLRWGDVRVAGEAVTLQFRRAKGGAVMADTLPAVAGRTLLSYMRQLHGAALTTLAADAPLWVNLATNGAQRALSPRSMAEICRVRLGVSKVHALRHTFARAMEDEGAKVSEIQSRLGHASLATTGRYLAALKRAENPHAAGLARRFGVEG